MIRSVLQMFVVAMLTSCAAYSQNTSNFPAPEDLLRGVESSRLEIPASRLRMTAEYSGRQYEFTAEFDGENRRRFWTRKNANRIRMVLSGTTVTHFDGTESVTIHDVNDQNGSLFFDPRLDLVQVSRIDAHVHMDGRNVSFTVPKDHWDDVLRALSPAVATDCSTTWIVLGTLRIEKNDGESLVVDLYQPIGSSAFKVEGTYYRGSSTESLIQELTNARRVADSS